MVREWLRLLCFEDSKRQAWMSPSSRLPGRAQAVPWGCEEGAGGQPGKVWQVLGTVGAHGHGDGRSAVALQ